ncbi:MAG: SagB/ThcOx family dehydrogenase [Alistipes sp.]|nr:SagB/ThcOx family dehydrogenase [Alistipes sp.]
MEKNIKLQEPSRSGGLTIQEAFTNRKSYRGGISDRELPAQTLSDLLWSANGVNREDGGRTAASAIGGKDIEIYAIMPQGAYKYNPAVHSLELIAEGDHRPAAAGGQDFVNTVPVVLVLVSDSELFNEKAKNYPGFDITPMIAGWSAMDAGIVTQNINLFCAGNGLATITRAFMDKGALRKILKLSNTQELLLNNAVGYPQEL